jgi:hypothetical protein
MSETEPKLMHVQVEYYERNPEPELMHVQVEYYKRAPEPERRLTVEVLRADYPGRVPHRVRIGGAGREARKAAARWKGEKPDAPKE